MLNERLGQRGAIHVPADDLFDAIFVPGHDFGDRADRNAGDIELCGRCAAQVMEVLVEVRRVVALDRWIGLHLGRYLGIVKRSTEAVSSPWPSTRICEHSGGPARDRIEQHPQGIVERDNRHKALLLTLAGIEGDFVFAGAIAQSW